MFPQNTKNFKKEDSLETIKKKIYTLFYKKAHLLNKLRGELGILVKDKEGDLKFKISPNKIEEIKCFERDLVYLEITKEDLLKLLNNPSFFLNFLVSKKIRIRGEVEKFFKIVQNLF